MKEFPNRKLLRLKNYDYSQNGCYFITICTYDRQKLFVPHVWNALCDVGRTQAQDETECHMGHSLQCVSNRIIEKWLYRLENKFNIRIDIYAIMYDHIHFILRIENGIYTESCANLQEMMNWFKTMTTNEYIRAVKSQLLPPFEKKIWQKSYYDHVIRNEQDYDETAQYIINNPLKYELP